MKNLLRNDDVIPALPVRHKATLARIYQHTHNTLKPLGENHSNHLVGDITKTNRPNVSDTTSIFHLRDKSNNGIIDAVNFLWVIEDIQNKSIE